MASTSIAVRNTDTFKPNAKVQTHSSNGFFVRGRTLTEDGKPLP